MPPEASSWRRPPVADVGQFRQYQQRAQQVGKNMPTSESLANAQQLLQALPRSCLTPRDQDPSLRDQREAQLNIVNYLERKQQQSGRGRAQRAGYSRTQEPPERRGYN